MHCSEPDAIPSSIHHPDGLAQFVSPLQRFEQFPPQGHSFSVQGTGPDPRDAVHVHDDGFAPLDVRDAGAGHQWPDQMSGVLECLDQILSSHGGDCSATGVRTLDHRTVQCTTQSVGSLGVPTHGGSRTTSSRPRRSTGRCGRRSEETQGIECGRCRDLDTHPPDGPAGAAVD